MCHIYNTGFVRADKLLWQILYDMVQGCILAKMIRNSQDINIMSAAGKRQDILVWNTDDFLLVPIQVRISTQLIQLITLLGICDIDDLILNTGGVVIGYLIAYGTAVKIVKK